MKCKDLETSHNADIKNNREKVSYHEDLRNQYHIHLSKILDQINKMEVEITGRRMQDLSWEYHTEYPLKGWKSHLQTNEITESSRLREDIEKKYVRTEKEISTESKERLQNSN